MGNKNKERRKFVYPLKWTASCAVWLSVTKGDPQIYRRNSWAHPFTYWRYPICRWKSLDFIQKAMGSEGN